MKAKPTLFMSGQKMVFTLGVVMLELLSGRAAETGGTSGEEMLSASIKIVLEGARQYTRETQRFIDPCLRYDYPFDLALSMAQLAKN